jgi:hypothetical protein
VERALFTIAPAHDDFQKCRAAIIWTILCEPIEMYNCNDHVETWHAITDKKVARSLISLASALEKVAEIFDSLSPQWQQVLFKNSAADKAVIGQQGITWPKASLSYNEFRENAQLAARRARIYPTLPLGVFVGGHGELERRTKPRKRHAANCAFDLLTEFAPLKPTLKPEGAFYNLARIMYEAFTGEVEASIERQCRPCLDFAKPDDASGSFGAQASVT